MRCAAVFLCVTKQEGRDTGRAPQPSLPLSSVLDHPEHTHAHGDQTYRQKEGKQGVAGHEVPDLTSKINQAVHAAHDGLHASSDSRLRLYASFQTIEIL